MKFCNIVLSGLLISSQFILSIDSRSVYYGEFRAFTKALRTKVIFTDYLGESGESPDEELFNTSLGAINRDIMACKFLSLFQMLLQYNLFSLDLVIVTPKTMPILYNYIDGIFHKAGVVTPVIFITRKKHWNGSNDILSKKILIFQGTIVIGQDLLSELSEGELEATIAREVAAIKYNHFNKKLLMSLIAGILLAARLLDKDCLLTDNAVQTMTLIKNTVQDSFVVSLLMIIVDKLLERQLDRFACKVLGKARGIIACCKRLKEKDEFKGIEFDTTYDLLQKNKSRMSFLSYILLVSRYYVAKISDVLDRKCDEMCYLNPEARIDAAQKYIS